MNGAVLGPLDPGASAFRALLESAFPEAERRPFEAQAALLSRPAYRLEGLTREGRLAAFFSFWELPDFLYLEHFAVAEDLRGGGLGTDAMRLFLDAHPRPLLLEVEPPEQGPQALRRVAFYRRLGFHLDAHPHRQPPFRPGGRPVPLRLMSWPDPLPDAAEASEALDRLVHGAMG